MIDTPSEGRPPAVAFWALVVGGSVGLLSGAVLPSSFAPALGATGGGVACQVILVGACFGIQLVAMLVLGMALRRVRRAIFAASITAIAMVIAPMVTWFFIPPGASAAFGAMMLLFISGGQIVQSSRHVRSLFAYLGVVLVAEVCVNVVIVPRWISWWGAASVVNGILALLLVLLVWRWGGVRRADSERTATGQ